MRRPIIVSSKLRNLRQRFPEYLELLDLAQSWTRWGQVDILYERPMGLRTPKFRILCFSIGSQNANDPLFLINAGVHGLERIGCSLALDFLNRILRQYSWDGLFRESLARVRLIVIPALNPGGIYLGTRANPDGIDLMRNAPVECHDPSTLSLVSGHRLSPRLPWYRGEEDAPMAPEAASLVAYVGEVIKARRFSLSLDLHSGFGLRDRIWYPYAHTKSAFPYLSECLVLGNKIQESLPHHDYIFEPQSLRYLTQGDLWDYILLNHCKNTKPGIFIPLTLEMGSWLWVKKNPRQLTNVWGLFNPILPHRMKRTLRRHASLFDTLLSLSRSYESWAPPSLAADSD